MCLQINSTLFFMLFGLMLNNSIAQQEHQNWSFLEVGAIVAGDETIFYGGYGKFTKPFSQRKHYFFGGCALTAYADFSGESSKEAYLRNDFDARIIPTLSVGYALVFNRFQLSVEVPLGASFAITKGTLVNEKYDFERPYSNKEVFFNTGITVSPKFSISDRNRIGLHGFLPLIRDRAQAGFQFGVSWTRKLSF